MDVNFWNLFQLYIKILRHVSWSSLDKEEKWFIKMSNAKKFYHYCISSCRDENFYFQSASKFKDDCLPSLTFISDIFRDGLEIKV